MKLLISQIVDIARLSPNHVAIEAGEFRTSYGKLILNARRFANILTDLDLGIGDRVVLCIENSVEYVEALLGCWIIGAIACPINAQATPREIFRVLKHSEARLIVVDSTNRKFQSAMPDVVVPIIMIPRAKAQLPSGTINWLRIEGAEPRDEVPLGADMNAMILYTSGTTGSPKGVSLTHRNILSNVSAIIVYLGLSRSDRILAVLPFNYSYGNSVLLTHLGVGATLVLGPSMAYPQDVVDAMRNCGITGFSGVPYSFIILLQRTDFAKNIVKLRYVTQAGGAMKRSLTESLLTALDAETQLFVMYGQTEATARLTYLPPERIREKQGSVGRAIPGAEIKIVNDSGAEMPSGTAGHIVARGDNIMAGYWQNPEATSDVLKDGWLHTGDLGYMDNEGFLFLHGRDSDMIKTGAHRVSPEEIEEVACEVEGVDEAAAVGVNDELLGQVIQLYIHGDGTEDTQRKVLRHCREQLATHKVPKIVTWQASLPRTESGKIQRFKLVQEQNKDDR